MLNTGSATFFNSLAVLQDSRSLQAYTNTNKIISNHYAAECMQPTSQVNKTPARFATAVGN